MIQIMAEENLNWSTAPTVMVQTVRATKEFLDAELAKYETWDHAEESFSMIFDSCPGGLILDGKAKNESRKASVVEWIVTRCKRKSDCTMAGKENKTAKETSGERTGLRQALSVGNRRRGRQQPGGMAKTDIEK